MPAAAGTSLSQISNKEIGLRRPLSCHRAIQLDGIFADRALPNHTESVHMLLELPYPNLDSLDWRLPVIANIVAACYAFTAGTNIFAALNPIKATCV